MVLVPDNFEILSLHGENISRIRIDPEFRSRIRSPFQLLENAFNLIGVNMSVSGLPYQIFNAQIATMRDEMQQRAIEHQVRTNSDRYVARALIHEQIEMIGASIECFFNEKMHWHSMARCQSPAARQDVLVRCVDPFEGSVLESRR